MKPVISVIIPIYESEKFLSKCVDSVLAQTFKDLELILVDDGSKDKSREICDYYAKKDDRVIVVHKLNSGANASRIVGINKSQGKYILFLDSDDMLPDRALESLYKCFLCNNIDIAIGSMIIMHNNKSKVSNNYLDNGIYNRESYIKALLTEKCHSGLHSKLYKKTIFTEDVFVLPENVFHHEDLFMNIAIAGNVNNVGIFNDIQAYIYTYQNPNSVSRSSSISTSEIFCLTYYIKKVLLKIGLLDNCIQEFVDHIYVTIYYNYILKDITFTELNKLKHDFNIHPYRHWHYVEILNNKLFLRRIFLFCIKVKQYIIKCLVRLKHQFEN